MVNPYEPYPDDADYDWGSADFLPPQKMRTERPMSKRRNKQRKIMYRQMTGAPKVSTQTPKPVNQGRIHKCGHMKGASTGYCSYCVEQMLVGFRHIIDSVRKDHERTEATLKFHCPNLFSMNQGT